MRLYLMQHALAYSSAEDSERPLNPDGVKQAKKSASGIKRLGLDFDLIMTSPKRRAQQTAALVAEAVRYPYSDIMTTEALLPDRTPDGLLELLQSKWNSKWLLWAQQLADVLIEQFEDKTSGGFFFTSHDHEQLIQRSKSYSDDATPSGNGIAAESLLLLGYLLAEPGYINAAERCLKAA